VFFSETDEFKMWKTHFFILFLLCHLREGNSSQIRALKFDANVEADNMEKQLVKIDIDPNINYSKVSFKKIEY
jgi:hypothetical protein